MSVGVWGREGREVGAESLAGRRENWGDSQTSSCVGSSGTLTQMKHPLPVEDK